jgi:hypothetical protein
MTITSILTPRWASYTMTAHTGSTFSRSLGLHQSCASSPAADRLSCRPFPTDANDGCLADEGAFCTMWRSTGFLMNLAAVAELVTLASFLVVMAGGKARRVSGWRVPSGLMLVVAAVEIAAVAITVRVLIRLGFRTWLSLQGLGFRTVPVSEWAA